MCAPTTRRHELITTADCKCVKPGHAKCPCGFRGTLAAVEAHVEALR